MGDFGADWLTIALGAAASLVGTIYLIQIFWPRIRSAVREVRDDPKHRTHELLQQYAAGAGRAGELETDLNLEFIRTAAHPDGLVVLFVNRGGALMNLAVTAPEDVAANIEPTALLQPNGTGHVRFKTERPLPRSLRFTIFYADMVGVTRKKSYSYSTADARVSECEDGAGEEW